MTEFGLADAHAGSRRIRGPVSLPPPNPAKAKYNACIRISGWGEEVVPCEDMSRGGFCFHSRRKYSVETTIEAAVPYTAGGANAAALPGALFRYGVATSVRQENNAASTVLPALSSSENEPILPWTSLSGDVMLSDVTISVGTQSITLPGLYLLIGVLIALGLAGFIVAMVSSRRIERKTSEVADILVVQLERIGDALDRLVTQSATRAVSEAAAPARQRDRFFPDWRVPGKGTPTPQRVIPEKSALERAAQKPASEPSSAVIQTTPTPAVAAPQQSAPEEQPVESSLSEPARAILFSMLGR